MSTEIVAEKIDFLERAHRFKEERDFIIQELGTVNSPISKKLIEDIKEAMKGEIEDRVAMAEYVKGIIGRRKEIERLMIGVFGEKVDILTDLLFG